MVKIMTRHSQPVWLNQHLNSAFKTLSVFKNLTPFDCLHVAIYYYSNIVKKMSAVSPHFWAEYGNNVAAEAHSSHLTGKRPMVLFCFIIRVQRGWISRAPVAVHRLIFLLLKPWKTVIIENLNLDLDHFVRGFAENERKLLYLWCSVIPKIFLIHTSLVQTLCLCIKFYFSFAISLACQNHISTLNL